MVYLKMRNLAAKIIKKVSLEMIYEIVDERTEEIKKEITELRDKQESDFKYLNQRLDQTNQRLDQTNQRLDQMNQRLDQRLDNIMQILIELSKQKN